MVDAARSGRVRDAKTALALLMAAGRPPLPLALSRRAPRALARRYACAERRSERLRPRRAGRQPAWTSGSRRKSRTTSTASPRRRRGSVSSPRAGHRVVVEASARGSARRSPTSSSSRRVPRSLPDADTVFAAAEMIVKVKEPQPEEYERFRAGPGALHLPAPGGRREAHAFPRRAQGHLGRLRDGADPRRPAAAARADVGDRRSHGAAGGGRGARTSPGRPGRADGRRVRRRARARVVVLGAGMAGANAGADRGRHGGRGRRSSIATSTGSATSTASGTGASRP